MTQKAVVAKDDVDGEDGGVFELNQLNKGGLCKNKNKTRDLAKFCNLHCNLPFLPSPKIRRVNYIILYLAGVLYATLQSTTRTTLRDLDEAKLRAVSLVLAPTCNIQRVSLLFFYLALL